MADPICRWRNSTPLTVCELVSQLPKTQIPSDQFRSIMRDSIYGEGFFTTAYQLACQLGLYVEENNLYTPRFCRDITEDEAQIYLNSWFSRYFVPNPYTKRGFKNMEHPVIVQDAFIEYLKNNNYEAEFQDITNNIFGESINNTDILVNCFRRYSDVITVDKSLHVTLNPDYANILKSKRMDRIDKSAFFQQLTPSMSDKLNNQSSLPLQQIFYGAPGTGKSFTIDDMADDDHSVRTTFHPDSDYASFVGAYKPTMEDMPLSAFVGKEVHLAQPQGGHTGTERKIVYKYVPQAFLKAYVAAWKDLDNDYYLVIEEINRGNCAQIFGDLFQLLDRNSMGCSSYAIHADDDIRQFLSSDKNGFAKLTEEQAQAIREFVLEKDNGKTQAVGQDILDGNLLLLPPNLHIWATMNTSDQSLFPIDSAFKRRWDWKYIPIDYKPTDKKSGQLIDWKFRIGANLYSWGQFLGKINPEIYTLTESSDKQMGYFFAKADRATGIISEEVFLNKVLFYLWTDVFKDFDVSSELFKNKKANRSFRFTDFFEDPDALENFIANFNLDAEEVDFASPSENGYSSIKVKINGNIETSMTQTMIAILKDAAPTHTMSEIEAAVKECITRGDDPIIKRVDNPETYTKENRWNPTLIYSSDNVPFVVTTMWVRRFLPMIENLANHFNIPFEVINE